MSSRAIAAITAAVIGIVLLCFGGLFTVTGDVGLRPPAPHAAQTERGRRACSGRVARPASNLPHESTPGSFVAAIHPDAGRTQRVCQRPRRLFTQNRA